ncbi:MAG: redoxin domain-containing protein [Chloroflexi bacterium]|nr:redoxin domain-containing protein [Chloroflexota bacterium]
MLRIGTIAPDFTGVSDDGGELTLSQLRGVPLVLYFYPGDFTRG